MRQHSGNGMSSHMAVIEVPKELLSFAPDGGCRTLWATDKGTYLVLGTVVTDAHVLAEVRKRSGNGIPDYETVIEVPRELPGREATV
ncbi:hypothetical protein [Tamaricihabitans halophyticus]|uniref:hypothetical protein n=1 Tax=Tamaricihabitans halophyticus TaxID=1262583 RepID=UPI001FB2D8A3|nr:hypothetical protein [Tamaricihabitans halophyticus]